VRSIMAAGAALLVAVAGRAQVLANPHFTSGLDHWYVANGVDWREHPQTPGSVTWSSAYGGSARMSVSGAPSSVHLIQSTNDVLTEGQQLVFEVWTAGMTSATFLVEIGTMGSGGETAQLTEPADGQHRLALTLTRRHEAGTAIRLILVTWPGSATCWVTSVGWSPR
jgi:hypothetical protein